MSYTLVALDKFVQLVWRADSCH